MDSSNGVSERQRASVDTEKSLEKIKKHLASGSGTTCLLQGPLLKRSETLRKWNERWVILDPTTGRMEYKTRRNEPTVKGTVIFDENSTIAVATANLHGLPKYDGCCFYIGTPQKKDHVFCAETPGAARAWVKTLHASQSVLKAHKEAVNSLSGNGSAKLGTVAAVVAAANATALECSKEIETAMQISLRNTLALITDKPTDGPLDDITIMKETLRVKDEELQNLAGDIRARDSTIKELSEKLSETAEAAGAAASSAYAVEEQRKIACAEVERLKKDSEIQLQAATQKLKESEEKIMELNRERKELMKHRDTANEDANKWRLELEKVREHVVILEAAIEKAEEKVRAVEAIAEARIKEASQRESASLKEKEELLAYVNVLKAQLERQHIDAARNYEKTEESSSDTKHVNETEENVDKACLSVTREESVVHMATDRMNIQQ